MRFAPSLLVLSLLAASASAAPIGRILVAVGDVSAQRNGKTVPLKARAEIELGDLIKTGPASNAQIRLTDGAIIAIKPVTEFKFDDYQFTGKQDGTEKGAFSLIKGGFRTITGAIGKQNPQNYKVATPMANIGIRGTFYNLAICDSGCFNPDGSKAKDGLYGGVVDGKIAVSNQAGEKTFGNDQFFHVASANETPQGLIAPPAFLQDKLEGQKQSKKDKEDKAEATKQEAKTEKKEGAQAAEKPAESKPTETKAEETTTTVAEDSGSGFKGDSRANVVTETNTTQTGPVVGATDDSYKANEDTASDGAAIPVFSAKQFLLAHAAPEPGSDGSLAETHGLSSFFFENGQPIGVVTAKNEVVLIDATLDSPGYAVDGSNNLALFWGKWINGTLTIYDPNGQIHHETEPTYFIGGVAPSRAVVDGLLTSQPTITFTHAAHTTPIFSDGNVYGTPSITPANSDVTINFGTLAVTTAIELNLNSTTYNLSTTGTFDPNTFQFTGTGYTSTATASDFLGCNTANTCKSISAGFLAGPNATHVGLGYSIKANPNISSLQVTGLGVFKNPADVGGVTTGSLPSF